jgi:hypothetical protein
VSYFIARLTRVLSKFGEGDWQLAMLICQTLWNYCTESTDLHAALGIDETNHLLAILVDFLGKVNLKYFFRIITTTTRYQTYLACYRYQKTESFCPSLLRSYYLLPLIFQVEGDPVRADSCNMFPLNVTGRKQEYFQ